MKKAVHDTPDQASLNQFITVAVAEKVSALHTAEFFALRAGTAQPHDLAVFLQRVPDRAPLPGGESASEGA